jgi:hypothetical protein
MQVDNTDKMYIQNKLNGLGWKPESGTDDELWDFVTQGQITDVEWMLAYEDCILTRVGYDSDRSVLHEAAYVESRKRNKLVRAGAGKVYVDEIVKQFEGLKGKRKVGKKVRSHSEEGSSSSSSSSLSRQARMKACAERDEVLDDMNIVNGLKKKRNVGSKKKNSGFKKKPSD